MALRWLWRVVAVLLAAPVALGALAPSAAAARWDDPAAPGQHPYLEGFLTVTGDQYRISWDPAAPSEDNRPVDPTPQGDAAEDTKFRAEGWFNYPYSTQYDVTSGMDLTAPRPSETFVSEALPRKALLNVTRGFQITLYLSTAESETACSWQGEYQTGLGGNYWFEPQLDLELYADGKLIGGAYGTDGVWWHQVFPTRAAPTPPAGYKACYYQMHSEVRVLEEGTVLTLKIHHSKQRYDYPFGLTGDHRSSIRIWEYPPEEILYRHPELVSEEDFGDASQEGGASGGGASAVSRSGGADPVLPLAAAGGLAAVAGLSVPLARGRGRRALVLVVGALLALSGCLTAGTKGSPAETGETLGGQLTNTLVKGGGELGSIQGEVHDDIHVPLAGVHVSILGLANFTQTDGKGRFQFLSMLPGSYKLRFDKNEYRSFEAEVEVKAGYISNPSIMLFLKNQKDADYRPHNHDYWNGLTQKTYPEQLLPIICRDDPRYCMYQNVFRLNPGADDARLVLPGTTELELTMSWEPARTGFSKVGLYAYSRQGNVSTFAPRGPGEPFHITTTWEMTDVGHSKFSGWTFYWFAPYSEMRSWEEQRVPSDPGTITMKSTVHRGGRLPLEAPHPDNWKGKDSIDITKNARGYAYKSGLLPSSVDGPCIVGYYDCSGVQYYDIWYTGVPAPISYGATWVEVTARLTAEPTMPYLLKLYYKPANVPFHMSNVNTLTGYKGVDAAPGSTWDKMVFRFKLAEGEADAEYAKSTSWRFTFRFTDEDAWWVSSAVKYTDQNFDIKAHRTAFPG